MHRNKTFLLFFSFIVACTLWFSCVGGFKIISYFSLSEKTPASLISIEIKEKGKNAFVLDCKFNFLDQEGKSPLGPVYPNRYSAEKGVTYYENKPLYAWYSKSCLEKAVLEKKFPIKSTLSACACLGLCIYFSILGVYVGKRSNSHY